MMSLCSSLIFISLAETWKAKSFFMARTYYLHLPAKQALYSWENKFDVFWTIDFQRIIIDLWVAALLSSRSSHILHPRTWGPWRDSRERGRRCQCCDQPRENNCCGSNCPHPAASHSVLHSSILTTHEQPEHVFM